jgi:hypothetical protein
LITGASDHPEAANYFIGNDIQYFGISTAISLGVTKIQRVLKKTPFWTNTMLFSHSLCPERTRAWANTSVVVKRLSSQTPLLKAGTD